MQSKIGRIQPLLSITTYDSEEEAIALANDSEYGLSGGVWSGDEKRALQFARKMRTGQVSINGGAFNISAPFGGCNLPTICTPLALYSLHFKELF